MSYPRPTLNQINARVQGDIKSKIDTKSSFLRRSWVNVFGRVMSGMVHTLWGYLQWIARQNFIVSADEESIIKKASLYGISRKPPAYAAGAAYFTGTPGVTIPSGTVISRADGVRYQTTVDIDLSAYPTAIPVKALEHGENGNLGADEALILESPIAGVNEEQVVSSAIRNGADIENINSLISRYTARVQRPPQGGSKVDYEMWTRELSNIGQVRVYSPGEISFLNGTPNFVPPVGEVWVYFSEVNAIATPVAERIIAVQRYLDIKKPVTATVRVFGIKNRLIAFNVKVKTAVNSTLSLARIDIRNVLIDLLDEQAIPTATVFLSQINESISKPSSEVDHVLITPSNSLVMGIDEIGKLDESNFVVTQIV